MDAPFYVLSSPDESTDCDTPNTSISSSSHVSSRARYHVQDATAFAEELNCAAKSAFPNRGRSRYESVNVCLIRWEEDELEVEPELRRLNNVFQDYGFKTNVWEIPSRSSHLDLMIKTGEFIRSSDSDRNLFVVYYGGHGRIDSERQAEWTCKRDPNYARVHWSAIQTLFAEAMSDTLILLDTCAAASATTRSQYGSMEVIMASGFEARAPPPGEHSFTNTLVDVLESWVNKRSFSASCLHAEILTKLKMKPRKKGREGTELEWCVTPIHLNCTQNSTALGIELCRRNVLPRPCAVLPENTDTLVDAMDIDFDGSSTAQSPLSSLSPNGRLKTPHVLISVALEEDQPDLDVKRTARWLESIPFLAKWAKVECVFPSYSTLLVLSVPVPIWNMLPEHPACSFIGYVTAPNLVVSSSLVTGPAIHYEKKVCEDAEMEEIIEDDELSVNSQSSLFTSDPQICIDEIKTVDPMEDNDVLKDFTYDWLSKQDSQWPIAADIRVKLFMHERNFYPLKDPDSHLLNILTKRLRRGTQVETCGTNGYVCLQRRVADRMCMLAKSLFDETLLEYDTEGNLDKSEVFESYWDKRYKIWDYGHLITSPSSTRESTPRPAKSITSDKSQQSAADSGYWTVEMRKDMESVRSSHLTISHSGNDSWKGGSDLRERQRTTDIELPSLKEQEQLQLAKISEVQHWMSEITNIRKRIRENIQNDIDPIVDYISLYRAAEIDADIRNWTPLWAVGNTTDIVGLLYKQMMWIYLWLTIYPLRLNNSQPDAKILQAVDDGIDLLAQFKPSDPRQTLILAPAFVIGCASFEEEQRESIRKAISVTSLYVQNSDTTLKALEEVWRLVDAKSEKSWDWQRIAHKIGLDFLAS